MAQNVLRRGGGGNHGDAAAMRREHPQDVALCSIIYRNDVKVRVLLSAIADLALPYGLGPFVRLPAGDLEGQIHTFETRPCESLRMEQRDVEVALRIVGDHPVWRSKIANAA